MRGVLLVGLVVLGVAGCSGQTFAIRPDCRAVQPTFWQDADGHMHSQDHCIDPPDGFRPRVGVVRTPDPAPTGPGWARP